MTSQRQLAAIMFTDIEGYSALMQRNEESAIVIRRKHRDIFEQANKKFGGKILQYYGDGTLSIYDSAIEAVQCAIDMQLGFIAAQDLPVRIGIHLGDILVSEEDIIGDGVNVAARIESLAVSGSILVSGKVHDEVKNHESIMCSYLRTFELKNIEEPTKVFAIGNEGIVVPEIASYRKNDNREPSGFDLDSDQNEPGSTPILATKLFIPPHRSSAIHRDRLIAKLSEGLNRKLTLICAPAGFGKTTLVSEWLSNNDRAATWLSLDLGDNDPHLFIEYMVAAFKFISDGFGAGTLRMLRSPQSPPLESILTVLLNEVASIDKKFTLVLDDYHEINSERVHSAVMFILDNLPPQMNIVITSRENPPFPLSKLRVRDQLVEIRISDLRFTLDETANFLSKVMGLQLKGDDIATLEARTEGWVAGLQLAALSMKGQNDTAEFIKTFAGDDRHVVDYLVEEVLDAQPENVRTFLVQTSILKRFNGELCESVTNQKGGKDLLDTLDRLNLFVIPLDEKRQWFRYHHLFADVLYSYLVHDFSDQIVGLHERASLWYESKKLYDEAIHHSLEAKLFERSAALIETAWPIMEKLYQSSKWMGWVRRLPPKLLETRPILNVGCAWAQLNEGKLEEAEPYLQEAERICKIIDFKSELAKDIVIIDEQQYLDLPATIANARAYHAQASGDIVATKRYAQKGLDLLGENDISKKGLPIVLLGFAHWANGDIDEAYQCFSRFVNISRNSGDLESVVGITFLLADIRVVQGRLNAALKLYLESLELATSKDEPPPLGTENIYLGLCELNIEKGDFEAATEYVKKSEELYNQAVLPENWQYRLHLVQARLKAANAKLDDALIFIERAKQLYHRSPIPNFRPTEAIKARLWLKQGRLNKAIAWLKERELSSNDELNYLNEFEHISLIRILLANYTLERDSQHIQDAKVLLKRLIVLAEEQGRIGSVIELLVLTALAYDAENRLEEAVEFLMRALTLAEPEGYLYIFIDEGRPMFKLLSALAANGFMKEYINKLTLEFEPDLLTE